MSEIPALVRDVPDESAIAMALVAVAVILLGAGIGVLGSTINAFSTVIASDAAGVTFADGLPLRLAILAVTWLVTVALVGAIVAAIGAVVLARGSSED